MRRSLMTLLPMTHEDKKTILIIDEMLVLDALLETIQPIHVKVPPAHRLHVLPRCYQDRTNQPYQAPCPEHPCVVFSCGVRLSEVGLSEFRKPQVIFQM
jgi:hypothetical protein